MPLTTAAIDSILDLLFNNVDWANVGDSTGLQGSSAAGVFYLSLHDASPGVGGNQTTNETAYTGYARVAVARTSAGWVRTGSTYNPAGTIIFPPCTAGTDTITYAGIGSDASGTGNLFAFATVTPSLAIANGVTPVLTTASTATFT